MQLFSERRRSLKASLVGVFAAFALAGCGGDSTAPDVTTLLDTTLHTEQGVTCSTGGVSADFTGQAGKTVTISVSGASTLTPVFVLYAPDYSTQLGASTANGAGKARLTIALIESGVHHVSLCEQNGLAGSLRVTVTTPAGVGTQE